MNAPDDFVNLEYVENELWPKIGFLPFNPENPSIILVAEFFLIELILKNSKDFNSLTLGSLKQIFENDIEENEENNLINPDEDDLANPV
jgi:hypothetical protein